jgi:ABC-type Fe3+/spermidine/putrescine transport system ATPase subunit
VLLLDEPLSNLDPALRERTRRELRRAIRRVGITTLLVTHEQEEAFHLGDRVAVLQGGVLHQAATPEELYDRPATRFVATFVGRASVLPGIFEGQGERGPVRLGPGAAWPGVAAEPLSGGEAVELVVRPEALALVPLGTAGALTGRVAERRYAGSATFYVVELAAGGLEVEVAAGAGAATVGEEVAVAPGGGPGAAAGRIFRRAASSAPPAGRGAESSLPPEGRS